MADEKSRTVPGRDRDEGHTDHLGGFTASREGYSHPRRDGYGGTWGTWGQSLSGPGEVDIDQAREDLRAEESARAMRENAARSAKPDR